MRAMLIPTPTSVAGPPECTGERALLARGALVCTKKRVALLGKGEADRTTYCSHQQPKACKHRNQWPVQRVTKRKAEE